MAIKISDKDANELLSFFTEEIINLEQNNAIWYMEMVDEPGDHDWYQAKINSNNDRISRLEKLASKIGKIDKQKVIAEVQNWMY